MNKFKKTLSEILFVSKITNVGKKKFKILISALLVNLTVFFDILIILLFSSFFTNKENNFLFLNTFFENLWVLPIIIFLRFASIYFEKLNIFQLQLEISENLKSYLLKEVYKKGNYSIADATFFITKLTEHISYFYGALSNAISGILQLIIYGSFLIYEDIRTVGGFFLVTIILFFPTRYLLSKGRFYMDQSYKFNQQTSRDTERVVENLFLIKILRTENQEFELFKNNTFKFTLSQLKNYKYGTVNSLLPNFAVMFIFSIALIFVSMANRLTLEFLGVTLRFFQTLGVLNNSLNMLVNSHVHLTKVLEIENNNFDSTKFKYVVDEKTNSIIGQNINFQYFGAETPIFEDISFEIKEFDKVLLTGQNGSGKSSLLGIISKILIPSEGTLNVFSNKFAYVGVKPLIIPGTLKDNLLYGNSNEVQKQKIDKLVSEFMLFENFNEENYNMIIDSKNLSSGQLQKISFIRALLSSPRILLLDESTSNIDENSKIIINRIVNDLDITVINSTHNLSEFKYDKHFQITIENSKRKLFIE